MVAEIEMKLETKFGARIAAQEKKYAVLNRLFSAVLDTASSTRLGGSKGARRSTGSFEWGEYNQFSVYIGSEVGFIGACGRGEEVRGGM